MMTQCSYDFGACLSLIIMAKVELSGNECDGDTLDNEVSSFQTSALNHQYTTTMEHACGYLSIGGRSSMR